MRERLKGLLGGAARTLNPQCRFPRALFVLAHMRCGSTALSNILCSRPDISGYGEAHVRYDHPDALGRLVVNQIRRGAWTPQAHYLFDKILHDRHDLDPDPGFYDARAIFVAREPAAAIRSIRKLYAGLGRTDEYRSDVETARYYIDRLATLSGHWDRFAPGARVGLTHAALLADPDAALARIGTALGLTPPLENRYRSPAASQRGGGGDPTASGQFTRIEPATPDSQADRAIPLDIPDALRTEAETAYAAFEKMTGVDKVASPASTAQSGPVPSQYD
ncbi:sulfotransferase [Jannaschia pohangensis]|uniref:Sulfotransferase family protein n=1 Tax=Jannaschia pohangensis TaxID=390807 RepID=A0A1I3QUH3_9RHOB|nr:sulfotransferase [Jannaschia pohangensis]SFJ36747.1 hypothetical protein SAMN04488095_2645 [Jannaschia pohangensis]